MLRKLALIVFFVALAAGPAWAQDHKVELGVFGGYTMSDGVTGNSVRGGDGRIYNSIEPKDSPAYGIDLGFFVNEHLQIGGLFSQQKSKMVLGGAVDRELGDWTVNNYHGMFTYNFGDSGAHARPFFALGLGATHYSSVDFVAATGAARSIGGETQFSTTWALGLKLYPAKNVGLKLAARWTPTYIKSDAAGWWCDPYWGCYVVGDAQYSNQFEFTGGLSFRF